MKKKKDINIKIYEGNNKYVNKNTKLGEIKIENLNPGSIEYKVKFIIDVNGELKVHVYDKNLTINKEETFRNITHAVKYDKKIKITQNKNVSCIADLTKNIDILKENIKNS